MADYYVVNKETGKLELHFDKTAYQELDDEKKSMIRSNFLWGRNSGCWISRCKWPNLCNAKRVAQELNLEDGGSEGERLTFAEQMERKAERAEHRADRYDARSDKAAAQGEALQKPITDMKGDIAFFTQPNINTSAGRAFTNRRNRMFAAFDKGVEAFRKSEYWADRAKVARRTADQKELQDKGFICRRIDERVSAIKKVRANIEYYEQEIENIRKNGPKKSYRWFNGKHEDYEITEEVESGYLEDALDRLEALLDELGFYQDCLDALGGVLYGKKDFKKGDLLTVKRWGKVRFLRGGPKNFTFEFMQPHMRYANGEQMQGQAAYAEIEAVG